MLGRPTSPRWALVAAVVALGGVAGAAHLATGSDHQDTPFVELNPKTDMTDVYAFPGSAPGRIVLVMDSRAFLTPAQATDPAQASFDPNLLYQFKVDNNGDAIEDKVIQVTFTGEGAKQQVQVRGPIAPPVAGAMENEVADASPAVSGALNTNLGSAERHPGVRRPSRRPVLHRPRSRLLHPARSQAGHGPAVELLRAQPNGQAPFYFRNPGINYVAGFNVNTIVVELPSSTLENGTPGRLGIWGTISQ